MSNNSLAGSIIFKKTTIKQKDNPGLHPFTFKCVNHISSFYECVRKIASIKLIFNLTMTPFIIPATSMKSNTDQLIIKFPLIIHFTLKIKICIPVG